MRVIDLSHKIYSGMMKFNADWHIGTVILKRGTISVVGRNTLEIKIGSHAGTHIDAAAHFIENGETVDEIPLDKLIGPVKIVDFSFSPPDYRLETEDLRSIALSERVIFNFGWHKYWETEQYYKQYPYFSYDAAQYIINAGVKVLGLDTPSPDDSKTRLLSENDSIIHKLFLSQGVSLIEYLTNLEKADLTSNWNLCALPLPIRGGDGSPARVCIFTAD